MLLSYYIVTSSYLFSVSVFIILLFYNQTYLLSYILSRLIIHPVVSVQTRICAMSVNDDDYGGDDYCVRF